MGRQPLTWVCAVGHTWTADLNHIKDRGQWCPHCAGNAPLTLDVAIKIAASRGGMCLSREYVNAKAPLHWRCSQGHEWKTTLDNVRNGGTWRPRCARKAKLSLNDAHVVAKSRGGLCL